MFNERLVTHRRRLRVRTYILCDEALSGYFRCYHRESSNRRSTEVSHKHALLHGNVADTLSPMRLSGHIIGLLKEYMQDLVEQARQESLTQQAFGFSAPPYQPDHAISDLLAILDDRIESEGVQVGLPVEVLHEMWRRCNDARNQIAERVWLESNVGPPGSSKARIRELTYESVIEYLERESSGD